MFGFSFLDLMMLSNEERAQFVSVISGMLRDSNGDAGALMFAAYRRINSLTNSHVRNSILRIKINAAPAPTY